jgi:hypothetical protein
MHKRLAVCGSFFTFMYGADALAHGAIAVCPTNPRYISMVTNEPTPEEAEKSALHAFLQKFGYSCEGKARLHSFTDTCVALATDPANLALGVPIPRAEITLYLETDSTEDRAALQAQDRCSTRCTVLANICDGSPLAPFSSAWLETDTSLAAWIRAALQAAQEFTTTRRSKEVVQDVVDDFVGFINNNTRQLKNTALAVSSMAIVAVVYMQVTALVRTGKRRFRDLLANIVKATAIVCAVTFASFLFAYIAKMLIAFGATLGVPGQVFLASSVLGIAVLAMPYSFWRWLGTFFRDEQGWRPIWRWLDPFFIYEHRSRRLASASDESTSSRTPTRQSEDVHSQSTELVARPVTAIRDTQPSPDASPQEGVVLRLKRSQKESLTGQTVYVLDARIEFSAEVRALIEKHRLGTRVIYESEARQRHNANTRDHLEATQNQAPLFSGPREHAMGLGRTVWQLARAGVSAARAALALRITVASLQAGIHVECKSMDELLEAESAIRAAKGNLEGYLEEIRRFDGTEEIV